MAIPQYMVAAEGFDIYPSGALAANYPWFVTNTNLRGQIVANDGAFQGNALTFPTSGAGSTLASGMEYQFPSTMQITRGNTAAGGAGAFAVNGWLNINTMTAGSGSLLAIGTAGAPGSLFSLLSISNTATGGTNLQFPTNINSPSSAPFNFNIQLNTYYWIQLQFAYYSTSTTASSAVMKASYTINGVALQLDVPLTWSADVFSAAQPANRLKFYASNFISYFWDDLVIQSVSSADSNWPLAGGVNPTPETVPSMPARQITVGTAVSNGSTVQMTPSGTEPNWQSATDPTGDNFVTATSAGQTDTYKWTTPVTNDVRAVVIKGNSNRYSNVEGSFKTSSVGTLEQMTTNFGPSRYISLSENDGTNAWTQTSIEAGEFGQTSR